MNDNLVKPLGFEMVSAFISERLCFFSGTPNYITSGVFNSRSFFGGRKFKLDI